MNFNSEATVLKTDDRLGLVMGFAIVCTDKGKPYVDTQGDHIPEAAMLKAATDFMEDNRTASVMHTGIDVGPVVFAWPLTQDIAAALGIQTEKTGLLIGMKPAPEIYERFKSGEFTGFSIGGKRITDQAA